MTYRLHYAPDNASLIVRLVLDHMGQPFTTTLVDRSKGAQRSPEYLALNPNGLIPVLETPDGPLFETAAILLYLADRHADLDVQMAPPPDSPDRGPFLTRLFFASNTLHAGLRMLFYPQCYVGSDPADHTTLRHHMQGELSRHLDQLEALAGQGRAWFAGANPSVLDFYVACQLRWMALYPQGDTDWFDLGNWPLLQDFAARLEHCRCVAIAIKAEGLGPHPFTAPHHAQPPEGSAT